ncbi:hypothetical protein QMY03_11630 [Arthrobacter sp. KFRI-F3372]|nr:hypothetical protein QMY03_11630 [Arthrobacter sp. KFRI-F3372]
MTPLADRVDRIFGSPAALAPASKVSATTVRSCPRSAEGNGAAGGPGSGAGPGPASGADGGTGTGGTVAGGWTGSCPASGVSVDGSTGWDGEGWAVEGEAPEAAGPGLVDAPGEVEGAAGCGGLSAGSLRRTARTMARTIRASTTAAAAIRRRASPRSGSVNGLRLP